MGETNARRIEALDDGEGGSMDDLDIRSQCFFSYVFPFLIHSSPHLYAPLAEEARTMLQGVGSRFDFHINKTLCDLRLVLTGRNLFPMLKIVIPGPKKSSI